MASITKKGNAFYVVFYDQRGKQIWEPAGKTKTEAKVKKTEIEKELLDGTYQPVKKIEFSKYAEQWFKNEVEDRLKPSTVVSYRGILDNYLLPYFGDYRLTNITRAMVKEFAAEEIEKGKAEKHKLSPRSIQYHLVLLKAILKTACVDGYLKQNPADYVKPPRQNPKKYDVLEPCEIKALLNATEEPFKTFFMVAGLTGLRRGEVLGLTWRDIDFSKRLIYVRNNVVMGENDTPKSDTSRRVVGISDRLHASLLNLQLNAPEGSEFIFVDEEGKLYDAAHISRVQFKKALKAAGITKRIRFHDLRHSFATLLKNQGVHRNDIQGVVGHSSAAVTDIYIHLAPEVYSKIATKAENAVFGEE